MLLPPYSYIVQVLTTDKEKSLSKNSLNGIEVYSEIYQIRIEAGDKGGGDFRNV